MSKKIGILFFVRRLCATTDYARGLIVLTVAVGAI